MLSLDVTAYAQDYPLGPAGGAFLAAIGAFLALGAFVPRLRQALAFVGLAAGTAALALFAARLWRGLPAPGMLAIGSLALAVLLEMGAFAVFIPRLKKAGERNAALGVFAIVAAHFFVMFPAFGPPIALLGALCLANAGLARAIASIPLNGAWFADGALKLAIGGWMISASPYWQTDSL